MKLTLNPRPNHILLRKHKSIFDDNDPLDIALKSTLVHAEMTQSISWVSMSNQEKSKMTFHCSTCNFSCKQKDTLLKHIAIVHEGNKPFHCHICENSFAKKAELKKHIKLNHEVKKQTQCSICNLQLSI